MPDVKGRNEDYNLLNHEGKSILTDFTQFTRLFECRRCSGRALLAFDCGVFLSCLHFLCFSCAKRSFECDKDCAMGNIPRKPLHAYTRLFRARLLRLTDPCFKCHREMFFTDSSGFLKQVREVYVCTNSDCPDDGEYICEVCQQDHLHGDIESWAVLRNHYDLWKRPTPVDPEAIEECQRCAKAGRCKICFKKNHFDHKCEPDLDGTRNAVTQILRAHFEILLYFHKVNAKDVVEGALTYAEPFPCQPLVDDEKERFSFYLTQCHKSYLRFLRRIINNMQLLLPLREQIVLCEYLEVFKSLHINMKEVYSQALMDKPPMVLSACPQMIVQIRVFMPPNVGRKVESKHLDQGPLLTSKDTCYLRSFRKLSSVSYSGVTARTPVIHNTVVYTWTLTWSKEGNPLDDFGNKYLKDNLRYWKDVRTKLSHLQLLTLQQLSYHSLVATRADELLLVVVHGFARMFRVQKLAQGHFGKGLVVQSVNKTVHVVYVLEISERKIIRYEFDMNLGLPSITFICLDTQRSIGQFDTLTFYKVKEQLRFVVCYNSQQNQPGFLEEFTEDGGFIRSLGDYGEATYKDLRFKHPAILCGSTNGWCLLAEVDPDEDTKPHLQYVNLARLYEENEIDREFICEINLPFSKIKGAFLDGYLRATKEDPQTWQLVALFHDSVEKKARVYCFDITPTCLSKI